MSSRASNLWRWPTSRASLRQQNLIPRHRRPFSTPQHPEPTITNEAVNTAKTVGRIQRINSKVPRFLRHWTTPLLSAPITTVSAFLILHELTAVIPLFGLAYFFHVTNWLPPYFAEGHWVKEGVERFERYFRRKGWLGDDGRALGEDGQKLEESPAQRYAWSGRGEGSVRWVVELGTAYAITKFLLPARLILSVWAAPSFARFLMMPMVKGFRRGLGFGKKRIGKATAGATTGAASGKALPKNPAKTEP